MRISLPTLLFPALLALLIPAAALHAATTPGVNGSIPGFDWTLRTTLPVADNAWVNVTYGTVSGNPLFVAVGTGGLSMTSPDGVTWTANTANTTHGWIGVTHNGSNQFVAVGTNTTGLFDGAMYSANGVTWTTATTPHEVSYSSVAYGNGTYVAVAETGTVDQQVMTSSDGSAWTARTAAEAHTWKDVAFGNGVFVAVTNNLLATNQVMRSTDYGANWTAVASPATKKGWYSVTYGAGKFVAVAITGTGQRVMTSDDDGQTWTLRDTPADNNWYSVSYGNGLFVAVADNGTDRVMTSPDGITWTARSAAANEVWFGVTYGDGRFVAVSASGAGTRAMSSGGPCGDGLAYTTNQWLMVGVPCQPSTNTVVGTFGNTPTANFVSGDYDVATIGWVMYERDVTGTPSSYYKMLTTDPFDQAYGLWLKSGTAPVRGRATVYDGTPWTVSAQTGCQAASCAVLKVETVSGDNRYNLVNNTFPYPVDWSKVRVRVNGTTIYTPTEAEGAGIMEKQIWIWNGNAYQTWSDTSSPIGNLKYFQSFWVNVLPGAAGQTVELLIPAEPSTHSQVVPLNDRLYAALRAGAGRLLDWLIPSATAADLAADSLEPGRAPGREGGPHPAPGEEVADPTLDLLTAEAAWNRGLDDPQARAEAHEVARAEGREWSVRLKLDQPSNGFYDHTNTIGQMLSAQDGYDPADLVEMPPFAAPYLTLDFPHPEWGARAGRYASDFRSAQRLNSRGKPVSGLPAGDWAFEIRADKPGGTVVLTWEGPPEILARSILIDRATGRAIKPTAKPYRQGYRLTLTSTTRSLVWRYLGTGVKP